MNGDIIEIELLSGKHTLLPKRFDKVYDICEKWTHNIKFTKHFPFISVSKVKFVSFKFRTEYETVNSEEDPRYYVNCTLAHLCRMFGIDIVTWERSCIENDLYN